MVFPNIFQFLQIYVALEFALASKFTLNCDSQQLSHKQYFQDNTREKWMLDSLKLAYILESTHLKQWLFDTSRYAGFLPVYWRKRL